MNYNGYPADEDAVNMQNLFKHNIAEGKLTYYSTEGDWGKDSDYYYFYEQDMSLIEEGALISRDKYIVDLLSGQYIEAFTLDTATAINMTRVIIDGDETPDWLLKYYFDDEIFYYGSGEFSSIGNELDAWKTSEEQAMFNIIKSVSILVTRDFQVIENENTNESIDEVITYKFKFSLSNIEVLERYPDVKNKLFYTLIRIPKEDVKALHLK